MSTEATLDKVEEITLPRPAQPAADAGTMEYESWRAIFAGSVEYDSWSAQA